MQSSQEMTLSLCKSSAAPEFQRQHVRSGYSPPPRTRPFRQAPSESWRFQFTRVPALGQRRPLREHEGRGSRHGDRWLEWVARPNKQRYCGPSQMAALSSEGTVNGKKVVRLGPGTNKTLQALARVARACPIPVRWALAHGPRWMHSTLGPLASKQMSARREPPWKPHSDRIDGKAAESALKGLRESLSGAL